MGLVRKKPTVTQITPALLDRVRGTLNVAFEEIGKDIGISIQLGRCTYTAANANFKLQIAVIAGDDGEAMTREAELFKLYCYRYQLKETDLFRIFKYWGIEYKIIGCAPKAPKFPILAVDVNGNRMRFPSNTVRNLLPKEEENASS